MFRVFWRHRTRNNEPEQIDDTKTNPKTASGLSNQDNKLKMLTLKKLRFLTLIF